MQLRMLRFLKGTHTSRVTAREQFCIGIPTRPQGEGNGKKCECHERQLHINGCLKQGEHVLSYFYILALKYSVYSAKFLEIFLDNDTVVMT